MKDAEGVAKKKKKKKKTLLVLRLVFSFWIIFEAEILGTCSKIPNDSRCFL